MLFFLLTWIVPGGPLAYLLALAGFFTANVFYVVLVALPIGTLSWAGMEALRLRAMQSRGPAEWPAYELVHPSRDSRPIGVPGHVRMTDSVELILLVDTGYLQDRASYPFGGVQCQVANPVGETCTLAIAGNPPRQIRVSYPHWFSGAARLQSGLHEVTWTPGYTVGGAEYADVKYTFIIPITG